MYTSNIRQDIKTTGHDIYLSSTVQSKQYCSTYQKLP